MGGQQSGQQGGSGSDLDWSESDQGNEAEQQNLPGAGGTGSDQLGGQGSVAGVATGAGGGTSGQVGSTTGQGGSGSAQGGSTTGQGGGMGDTGTMGDTASMGGAGI